MQFAAPDPSCRGAPKPRMDNFAVTCRSLVLLRPATAICCRADTSGSQRQDAKGHPPSRPFRYECQRQTPSLGHCPIGRRCREPCPTAPAEPFPWFPTMPKRELIIIPLSACNRRQGCEMLQVSGVNHSCREPAFYRSMRRRRWLRHRLRGDG